MSLRFNERQFENSRMNLSEVIAYKKPKTRSNTFYLVFHAMSI